MLINNVAELYMKYLFMTFNSNYLINFDMNYSSQNITNQTLI